jgi:glycogen operon protein
VNFALFSENATGVELCLFRNDNDAEAAATIKLTERTDQVWHCFLPDVRPGQYYGYRVTARTSRIAATGSTRTSC